MPAIYTEDKETIFAYHTIHDFFDSYTLPEALEYLQSALKSATGKKIWKTSCPHCLVNYTRQLNLLSAASSTIQTRFAQRPAAVIQDTGTGSKVFINNLGTSVGNKAGDDIWSCFPRSLTLTQFLNPYKAIKKFNDYMTQQEWEKAFEEIQQCALSKTTIVNNFPPYNIIMLQVRISQLIEACHLIEVRAGKNTKKTGKKNSNTQINKKREPA